MLRRVCYMTELLLPAAALQGVLHIAVQTAALHTGGFKVLLHDSAAK
jgi:hypothetical protein